MKRTIQWTMVTLALFCMLACGDTNVAGTQECAPGVNRCTADGSVETCTDGGQFVFSKQCAVDEQCSAGECVTQTIENPCTSGTHSCDANATCVEQEAGAYSCDCNAGFSGNGFTCTDINACTTDDDCISETINACLETQCIDGVCTTTTRDEPTCCDVADDCFAGNGCDTVTCENSQCMVTPIPNCCDTVTDCIPDNPSCQQAVMCNAGQCVYESSCCTEDSECNDDYLCTTDTCVNGSCQFDVIDDCCTSDAACTDIDPCTTGTCGTDNTCVVDVIEGCCTQQSDCADDLSCSVDSCINNTCDIDMSACCAIDADCPAPSATCKEAKCDATTGNCGVANKSNGTSCGVNGTCQAGACKLSDKEGPKSPSS